jgi:hypothetical protein
MAEQARHRVVLNFDDGLRLKLICPETGCRPATQCGECYRHVDDEEREPCGACPGPEDTGCWVLSWFENCTYDELLHGEVTVEIDTEWDGESLLATITGPAPSPSTS